MKLTVKEKPPRLVLFITAVVLTIIIVTVIALTAHGVFSNNCTTENVENGHFDLETVKEGMNATIMCDPGYQNRKPVRMCRDSQLRPLKKYHPYHCKKVCGKPPELKNIFAKNYDYNDSLDVLEGEVLDYKCLPCYWAHHDFHHVVCRENGKFSPSMDEFKLKCHKFNYTLKVVLQKLNWTAARSYCKENFDGDLIQHNKKLFTYLDRKDLQKCLDLPPGKYHLGVRKAYVKSPKSPKWRKVSNDKIFNYDKIADKYHHYDEDYYHYDYNETYYGNMSDHQGFDYNASYHGNLSDHLYYDYSAAYHEIKSNKQDYDYGETYQGNLSNHLVWIWSPHDDEFKFGNWFYSEPDQPAYFICEYK